MVFTTGCLICEKHRGIAHPPPGGYIWRGAHFSVCHAPLDKGPLGTLFIESNRHLLDYADMNREEIEAYGVLLSLLYSILKDIVGAARIYQVTLLEGIPHFHTWLVPRRLSDPKRGMAFLMRDLHCSLEDIEHLAAQLKHALGNFHG